VDHLDECLEGGGQEGTPSTKMENNFEEVSFMIQAIESLLNPKSERRECMYYQLSRSKDLERLIFMSIPGVKVVFRE